METPYLKSRIMQTTQANKMMKPANRSSKFERFRAVLRQFNMTPEMFGDKIGVSRASVYAWLTDSKNYGQRPTVENRAKIQEIIGTVHTKDFFD